jgi:hypothetical protein
MSEETIVKDKEKTMVREAKEALDKANKRNVILAEKCPRCGKVHPRIRFYWKKCTDGYPGLHIEITCPDKAFLDKVFEIEFLLGEIGFHFDTGYGGARDWEFDWSLAGDHFVWDKRTKAYVQVKRGIL